MPGPPHTTLRVLSTLISAGLVRAPDPPLALVCCWHLSLHYTQTTSFSRTERNGSNNDRGTHRYRQEYVGPVKIFRWPQFGIVVFESFSFFASRRKIPIFCLDVKSNEWLGWQSDSSGCQETPAGIQRGERAPGHHGGAGVKRNLISKE